MIFGKSSFGHNGEKAISAFFSEGAGADLREELSAGAVGDLINFEGNANAFRQLTHQFNGRRKGRLCNDLFPLASIVKYPYESRLWCKPNRFGFSVRSETLL